MKSVESFLNMYENKNECVEEETAVYKETVLSDYGFTVDTVYGSFYMIEKEYDIDYIHGNYALSCFLKNDISEISRFSGYPETQSSRDDILFLDTETSGLSYGVSTYVFLIGTGYFRKDKFIIRQYFMRDLCDESAMFNHFSTFLKDFRILATFNGKAFDMNLIKNRLLINAISDFTEPVVHIDLLHTSRKLWRDVFENCKLSTLERKVLGVFRSNDIPGHLIPNEYFRFINYGNTEAITKILSHNELDILSMVTLIIKTTALLINPILKYNNIREIFNLGKYCSSVRLYDRALVCYDECAKQGPDFIKYSSLLEMSLIYKRIGKYKNAVSLWKHMIDELKNPTNFPYIELAKYYEHIEKNYETALDMTGMAIRLECERFSPSSISLKELNYRQERLLRKKGGNAISC